MKTIQHRLEQIIASSKAVIYSAEIQSSHATTFISDNITSQMGYEQYEFMDDPTFWICLIHDEDKARVLNALNHVPKYGYASVEYRLRHQDGNYHWMHHDLMCSRDTQGNPNEIVGFWIDITEQKEMEQALQDSDAKYRDIFEAAHDIILLMDKDCNILEINHRAEILLGYSKAELLQMNIMQHLNVPEDRDLMAQVKDDLIQGLCREFIVRWTAKDGQIIHLDGASAPRASASGEFISSICTLRDITERKTAEDELESLYRATAYLFKADSLLNLGHQIVQAVVREFAYADCGLLLVDRPANKLIRLARTGEYVVNTDAPLYLDGVGLVPHAVRAGKIVYTPDVSANADYATNEPRTRSELVVPLQTVKGVLGVIDLQSADLNAFSERDERILVAFAERAAAAIEVMQLYEKVNLAATTLEGQVAQRTMQLQNAKERIETILNNTSDAIVLLNSDGIVQQVNRPFSELFGFVNDEIFRQPLQFLVATDQQDNLTQVIQSINTTRLPIRIELLMHNKAGLPFDAAVALAPITDYDSQTPSIICSIHDMSQRKRAEEDLRHALKKEIELNELKSNFVSMVSHEFRTPLTVIMTSADIIRRYKDRLTEEKQNEHFDRINAQIKRLAALMEDVLTIGKADIQGIELDLEHIDLEALCRNIVDEIQSTAPEQEIQLSVSGDCTQATIDPKLFRQILTNLLSNAIKYSSQTGIVRVELSRSQATIHIRVIDQGIGIPETDLKHLFETFHRATNVGKIQGTGLGLAIVKQAVEAHKGTITVESKIDEGTAFTVIIPMMETLA